MSEESKKQTTAKTTEKVDKEVAELEFARFAEVWDIDDDTGAMSQEDKESFNQQKGRILREIMRGNATVEDDGNITYRLQHPKGDTTSVTFKIPKGSAYISMDQHKERQNMHKLCSFMGEMTGQAPRLFSQMDGRDMKFCMGVAALFLGS